MTDITEAARVHAPALERTAENQRPKTSEHNDAKLHRYVGTDLYQWFSKRGTSVFEDPCDVPFVIPTQREGPVAWRYAYVYPGRPIHWKVRQTTVLAQPAQPGLVEIIAEPLFTRPSSVCAGALTKTLEPFALALRGLPKDWVDGRPVAHINADGAHAGTITTITAGDLRALVSTAQGMTEAAAKPPILDPRMMAIVAELADQCERAGNPTDTEAALALRTLVSAAQGAAQ